MFLNTGGVLNYAYAFDFGSNMQLSVGLNVFGYNSEIADDIEIVDFKDRINSPTSGGWRDVLILFRIKGASNHVCEMQIALHMMLTARKEMGAHAAYAEARHYIELYEIVTGSCFEPDEFFVPQKISAQER